MNRPLPPPWVSALLGLLCTAAAYAVVGGRLSLGRYLAVVLLLTLGSLFGDDAAEESRRRRKRSRR